MDFETYRSHDATALADLVQQGDVTADELLHAAIARAEAVNPQLNAITLRHDDLARKAIADGLPKGPFQGVPFLLKDLYALLAGTPLTNGSRLTPAIPAPYDSTLVARAKATGVVIFGKTASPELGVNISTEPLLHGPCRNPFDLERSVGGSSGGAAAAVAAGIVPMAHATDGGGSIRIPAASCGLVGLKPSRGRNPIGPDAGEGWNGLACGHVISRTVRDSARMLDALSGSEPGDPYACPPPRREFADELGREVSPIKIGLVTEAPLGTPIHADCLSAVEATAKTCEGMGHHVEPVRLDFVRPEVGWAMITIVQSNLATDLAFWQQTTGLDPKEHCENITLALAEGGRSLSAVDLERAIRTVQMLGRKFGRLFERHDVVLMPSLAAPPAELGHFNQNDPDLSHHLGLVGAHIPFMPLANMTGCPAITLPLHQSEEGLPLGSMMMA
ncbi:MAG: amidase family protein, partial [Pseudomonadota bacterium]